MCGIAGVIHDDRERPVPESTLRAMLRELRFRGPDAEGIFLDQGLALGHRRLSVIDLAGGRQPMTDASGRFTLCFNGEIYNFQEIRAELQTHGSQFQTRSDTEVLLLGYQTWRASILDRLAGMFAFAIWDRDEQTLFLARDRFGVKPLYWALVPGRGLVFASELSAVLASNLVERRLSRDVASGFLSLGYITGDGSLIKGVQRLAPGMQLEFRRGAAPKLERYWSLGETWTRSTRAATPRDPVEAEDEFGRLLRLAVKQRLVSDVPMGAFLSGGLDSSTIAALMKEETKDVETFSVGFSEDSYDELPWARMAARHLGTRHRETVVSGSSAELLVEISQKQDEPFADTSIIPTYVLCREARRHVTVALSGDGADELLAGYVTQMATALQSRLRKMPDWLLRLATATARQLPDSRKKVSWNFKVKQFAAGLRSETWAAHASWRLLAVPEKVSALLGVPAYANLASPLAAFRRAYEEVPTIPPLDRFLYVDYRTWLVDDILVKVDRASAGCGLEVRSPFLDHRLVEYCAGLPPEMKLRRGRGKWLLRRFASKHLPSAILKRKKSGFNAPVSHWICGSWRPLVEATFSPAALAGAGLLDPGQVRLLLDEHFSGRRDHGYLLFALLMLSLWVGRIRPTIEP